MVTARCGCGETLRVKANVVGDRMEIAETSLVLILGEFLVEHHACDASNPVTIEANAFPSPMSYKGRKRSRRVG